MICGHSLTDRVAVCGTADSSSILDGRAEVGGVPEWFNGQLSKSLQVEKST